jgi:hypothetical protein
MVILLSDPHVEAPASGTPDPTALAAAGHLATSSLPTVGNVGSRLPVRRRVACGKRLPAPLVDEVIDTSVNVAIDSAVGSGPGDRRRFRAPAKGNIARQRAMVIVMDVADQSIASCPTN